MARSIAVTAVVLALICPGAGTARADAPLAMPDTTVQGLYAACTRTVGVADAPDSARAVVITVGNGYCYGFLDGILEMMTEVGETGTGPTYLTACINPPGTFPTTGALEQVFTKWAEKHPEAASNAELTGVVAAFHETWPCPLTQQK